jgi:hypothetical protein
VDIKRDGIISCFLNINNMKLQNNFTTTEQSRRLLELGVPAWTADCYYKESGKIEIKNTALDELFPPCWSVGRLIEIYGFGTNQHIGNIWYRNSMECIIADIEIAIENGEMDFSKLEE